MFQTPILLIIFNRFETTIQVFEQIRKLRPGYLFIAADGPRPERIDDEEKCTKLRKWVLDNIDWECEIKTLFQKQNLGCGRGPAAGITWFFDFVEEGIILEDDCVPDLTFFEYCAELLEKYRYDNRISIISGVNFDTNSTFKNSSASYFFSVFPFTWGWATWKHNWDDFDYNISKWGNINKMSYLKFLFDDIEFQLAWKNTFDKIYKDPPIDIWDYQFFFSCFYKKQFSIVPGVNLITNIGIGYDAIHTVNPIAELSNLTTTSIIFPLIHPFNQKRNLYYDIYLQNINFGKIQKLTLMRKIKSWIKKRIKNLLI